MTRIHALIALYLLANVIANLTTATLIGTWPVIVIVNSFLWIGLDLTSRDALHEAWIGRGLWPRMVALICFGGLLSAAVNVQAAPIAIASCLAFVSSAMADTLVFHWLRVQPWLVRVNGSNVVSAVIDSGVFLSCLALFGGLPWALVPWLMLGQTLAKIGGGFVWSVVLPHVPWRWSRVEV